MGRRASNQSFRSVYPHDWAKIVSSGFTHPSTCFWDVQPTSYGGSSPEDVVEAALAAGLDTIAITDHNTSSWCENTVATAAEGTPYSYFRVLKSARPKATSWRSGKSERRAQQSTSYLFDSASAATIKASWISPPKWGLQTPRRRSKRVEACNCRARCKASWATENSLLPRISNERCSTNTFIAVEVVDLATTDIVSSRLGGERMLACVRGSDVMLPASNAHVLAGIGNRRTWIKASRPDLIGIRHALDDPDFRVRLEEPPSRSHPYIESVSFSGGFFDGKRFDVLLI